MLNTVFDYHNENKEGGHPSRARREQGEGPSNSALGRQRGTIRLVYDGEPTFSYKEHLSF